MRYVFLLVILLFAGGCASSISNRIERAPEKSTFSTGTRSTDFSFNNGGLSGSSQVLYQVVAHCKGPNCVPKKARLSFHIQSGLNKIYLNNRDLLIHADNKKYDWDDPRTTQRIENSQQVVGKITSVMLEQKELKQIASAKKVSGNLAGHSFKWSYDNREPLRKLISQMQTTESTGN